MFKSMGSKCSGVMFRAARIVYEVEVGIRCILSITEINLFQTYIYSNNPLSVDAPNNT
jgi:hypothetical protein